MNKINILQNKIMRRVYYAYGLRLATHTVTKHMIVLAVLGLVLAKLVHVAAVYQHFAEVQLGDLGSALVRMFMNADLLTLVVFGLAIFTALSLRLNVGSIRMPSMQTA